MTEAPERVIERIKSRIEVNDSGCWIWTGAKTTGYGRISWKTESGKIWRSVHRVLYVHEVGPVADGLDLDHLCHDPKQCKPELAEDCPHRACCNPAHLSPTTRRENLLRGGTVSADRRAVTHCPQGHELNAGNTLISTLGQRQCKACTYERNRAYYHQNKERRARYNREWRERRKNHSG